MEEHARHGVCLSQVVGDEPGGSLGAGLGQQWGIGAARLHLFKDDVVLQAIACDTDTGWKKISAEIWGLFSPDGSGNYSRICAMLLI